MLDSITIDIINKIMKKKDRYFYIKNDMVFVNKDNIINDFLVDENDTESIYSMLEKELEKKDVENRIRYYLKYTDKCIKGKPYIKKKMIDDVYKSIKQQLDNDHDKAFAFFLYMTGSRVSETLQVTKGDIEKENNFILVTLKTLKNRKQTRRTIKIPIGNKSKCFEDEMWIYVSKELDKIDENDFIFFKSQKRKTKKEKENLRKYAYKVISKVIITNVNIDFKDENGNKITEKKDLVLFNHFLRHLRANDLVRHYKMNDILALQQFFGWTDGKPAQVYIRQDPDIFDQYFGE